MAKGKTKYDIDRLLKTAFSIILPLAFWIILTVFYRDFLTKVESRSLFMWDWQPLLESFGIPGGLLCWLGTFFMQFLHLPWLGALLWTAMLMISVPLTKKAFHIPDSQWIGAVIPAFLLAMGNMSLGYAVFVIKGAGWFFVPTLGYLAMTATVLASDHIKNIAGKIILMAITATIGFWLGGCYALTATVLTGFMAMKSSGTVKPRFIYFAAAVILAAVAPIVIHPIFTTYRLEDSWAMGMPASDIADLFKLREAYMIIFIYLVLAVLFIDKAVSTSGKNLVTQLTGIVMFLIISWLTWHHDTNFMTELAMTNAADCGEWKKAASILEKATSKATKSDERAFAARSKALTGAKGDSDRDFIVDKYSERFFEPTRPMVLLKDLALFKLGVEGDKAFMYRDGDRKQNTKTQVPMVSQIGQQLYFYYGMPNYCYRWCIEEAVEYGWSYQNLRYMAMTAIAMEEWDVARKFLDKLSSTLFYRKWAAQQKSLLGNSQAVSQTAPYSDVQALMCYDDRLSSDMGMVETFIMEHFIKTRPLKSSPQFDRAALLWAMRTQDIPAFWRCFYFYLDSNSPKTMPRHYQEAAYLYNSLEESTAMKGLPFDKNITEGYASFMKFNQNHPVRTIDESRYQFMKKFGGTFFFYYYFIRNQETF